MLKMNYDLQWINHDYKYFQDYDKTMKIYLINYDIFPIICIFLNSDRHNHLMVHLISISNSLNINLHTALDARNKFSTNILARTV